MPFVQFGKRKRLSDRAAAMVVIFSLSSALHLIHRRFMKHLCKVYV